MSIILTIIISYFTTTLFGYIIHRSLHQPWTGWINKSHMKHHLELYPSSDYLSDTYRHAGSDSTPKFFIMAAIPILFIPTFLLHFIFNLSWGLTILALVVMILVGLVKNYMHDAFHIRNHILTRIPYIRRWFNQLVRLHYSHHVDMGKNFGITSFFWDRVFKTFDK